MKFLSHLTSRRFHAWRSRLLLFVLLPLTGLAIDSAQSGDWTAPATWVGGTVPTNQVFQVLAGHTVTAVTGVNFNSTTADPVVDGTLNVGAGATLFFDRLNNSSTAATGIINVNGGSLSLSRTNLGAGGALRFNITAGSLTTRIAGNLSGAHAIVLSGGVFSTVDINLLAVATITGGTLSMDGGFGNNFIRKSAGSSWNGGMIVTNGTSTTSGSVAADTTAGLMDLWDDNATNILKLSNRASKQTLTLNNNATNTSGGQLHVNIYGPQADNSDQLNTVAPFSVTLGSAVQLAILPGAALPGPWESYVGIGYKLFTSTTYTGIAPTVAPTVLTIEGVDYAVVWTNTLSTNGTLAIESLTALGASAAPTITTTTLPNSTAGTAYAQTLTATGGNGTLVWSLDGGTLPTGLALSATGVISGTPTTEGTSTFTVRVADSDAITGAADEDTQLLSITVSSVNSVPSITTTTLPNGAPGTAYAQTLTATGGNGTLVWSLDGGTMPAGLSLSAAGGISGTPTAEATNTFTVRVADSDAITGAADEDTQALSITIASSNSVPAIATSTLPNGSVGAVYSQTLAATGGNGTLAWSLDAGTLPAGLNLSATGIISGTPAAEGTNTFTVRVADSDAVTGAADEDTQELSIAIATAPTSNVVAAIAVSRVSGVAPLAVHFDASASTSSATSRPFHDCHFEWNYGDPGSGLWSTTGKSRNRETSPIGGHVFETPGNYTVTLTVRDSTGATDTETVNITVADPDVVFSGANTICISTDGDFTGAPSGAQQVTASSWTTAAGYLGTGKRVLLKRGQTWDVGAGTRTMTFAGPGILGAFGTGAKPVLRFTSATGNLFQIGSGGTPGQFADFRFMDLEVDGAGYLRRVFQAEGMVQNITFLRLDVHDTSTFIQMAESTLDYYNGNGQPGHTVHSGIAIVETTFDHLIGTNNGQNVAYMAQQKFMFLGNVWNDSMLGEHIVRMRVCKRTIIAHSRLTNAPGIRHLLKLHAPPASGVNYLPSGEWMSNHIVIADNYFSAEDNDWLVSVGPQNDSNDERVMDVILERNTAVFGAQTQLAFQLSTSETTVRNNVVILSGYPEGGRAVAIERRGIEPMPQNNRVYNNSAFHATGPFTFISVGGSVANTTVRNNLIKGGGSPVMIAGGGTNLQESSNVVTATPGWVAAAPVSAADFTLAPGSMAIDAGATVPVFTDHVDAGRPLGAAWDLGAFEYNSTPVAMIAAGANAAEPATPGTFTVTVAPAPASPVTVNLTVGGTATNGLDYTTIPGTVVVGTGGSAVISVAPLDDALAEGNETVVVTLASGTGYGAGGLNSAMVQLADDEEANTVPSIGTTGLPIGSPGVPYNAPLAATGGNGTLVWSLASGSLPAGLTLSSGGVISGTPVADGSSTFVVRVADSDAITGAQDEDTQEFTLLVRSAPVISTVSLPGGAQNAGYNVALQASGGTGALVWSLTAGSLPAGLSLSTDGVVSGTPTVSGNFNFTVKVADSDADVGPADEDSQALSLSIADPLAPVLWYRFNETGGTTVTDASGHGNTGTLAGGPAFVAGKDGNGLQFDGAAAAGDDLVDAGSAAVLDDLPSVTMAAWVFPTSTGEGGFGRFLQKGAGGSNPLTGGFRFQLTGTNQIQFLVAFSGTDLNVITAANSVTLNAWNHVAVTWTGELAASSVHVYVNGVEVSHVTADNATGTRDSDAGDNLIVGNNVGGSRTFGGIMDDLRVYNRTLGAAEVAAVQHGALPEITQQPVSATVSAGGSATLVVVATGEPAPTFQWFHNDAAIAGATNPTLVLANVQSPAAGAYKVTATNAAGSVTSQVASVTVIPAVAVGLPQIGAWTTVATQPNLGALGTPGQQMVDFAIWPAADGKWQLWSCIRGTNEPGRNRLFFRWEGVSPDAGAWTPVGIAMQADTALGETAGGLQAPHVIHDGAGYRMFYGDWVNISSQTSPGTDGKTFTRLLAANGRPALFSEGPEANTRDAMVIRIGGLWYCYYTAYPNNVGSVYVRTSTDLVTWSVSSIVAPGGAGSSDPKFAAECPYVVEPSPGEFVLFYTQRYGNNAQTTVLHSNDPMNFDPTQDPGRYVGTLPVASPEIFQHNGLWYIAALRGDLNGIQIAPLEWTQASADSGPKVWLKFDETVGTTAADSSGNGNIGTLVGGPTFVAGRTNNGLQFDGAPAAGDDLVNVGSAAMLDTMPAMTLAAWAYPETTGEGGFGRFMQKGAGGSNPLTGGFRFQLTGTNQIQFIAAFSGTDLDVITAPNSIALNQWSHVTVSWNGSTDALNVRIYVNGVEATYTTRTSATGTRDDDSADSLIIGNNSGGSRTFDGILDDVLVYDRAFTAAEAGSLHSFGPAGSAPSITAGLLPQGETGVPFSHQLTATGGDVPYSWTLAAGSLPAGLSLSPAGVISGTPTAAGTSSFTVRVGDSDTVTGALDEDTREFVLTINAANTVPVIVTGTLPAGTVGVEYSQVLEADGGNGDLVWSVATGSLPAGLGLSPAGILSGVPTAAGVSTFTVKVADSDAITGAADEDTQEFSITVEEPGSGGGLAIVSQPQNATVAAGGSATLSVTAASATGYQWRKNGTPISGATATSLTLANVAAVDTGTYDVAVTNGTDTLGSDPVTLVVRSLPFDQHGWTVITLSPDSRVVYVSSSTGSDSNDGLTPATPKATIAAGDALIRDGFPDHLLLKRGDTFASTAAAVMGRWKNGRSAREPVVLSYYGDAAARPVIKIADKFLDHAGQARNYQAFIGLDLYKSNSDPASPDFANVGSSDGLRFVGGGDSILVEDCRLRFTGILVQSFGAVSYANFRLARSIVLDTWVPHSWSQGSTARVSGLFLSGTNGYVLEENVFDHNGWNEIVPDAGANQFNHNIYVQYDNAPGGVMRGNILTRGSAHGLQARSGGVVERNLFSGNAVAVNIGGQQTPTNPAVLTYPNRGVENIILSGRLMDPLDSNQPNRTAAVWGIWAAFLSDVLVRENIVANRIDSGTNSALQDSARMRLVDNLVYQWDPAFDSVDPTWPHPDADIADYYSSIGGHAAPDAYLEWLRNRPVRELPWSMTAYAAIDYIRSGFNRGPVGGYYAYDGQALADTAPVITSTALPAGQVGDDYLAFFSASGGNGHSVWTLASGSLPPGITLTPAGALEGTPTQAGAYSFSVRVADSDANTSAGDGNERTFGLNVNAAAVSITATTAAAAEAGASGRFTFTATPAPASPLTVNLTIGGTATNGLDYTTIGSTIVIDSSGTAVIDVNVTNDTAVENPETVTLGVAPGTGYSVSLPSTATVTIADDDNDGSGLIGYWKLDEADGTIAADSSGHGNTGALSGPVPVAGVFDLARDFDQTTDVINAGNGNSLNNPAALTISAWIRPRTLGFNTTFGRIVQKGNGTNSPVGYRFTLAGTNQLEFIADYSGADLTRRSAVNTVTLNAWQHVAVTWSGSGSAATARIYVNGVEVASYATTTDGAGTRGDDSATGFYIGSNDVLNRTFNGAIDEVRVYNRALTAAEVANLTANTVPVIQTTTLPDAAMGTAYAQTLAAVGGDGPLAWSLAFGALPEGLTLSTEGVIAGSPTTAGTSAFTVKVADGDLLTGTSDEDTQVLTITVGQPPVVVTLGDLNRTYDGSPKPVSVSTVPAGIAVEVTYGGSTTAPVGAGSYPVTATVTQPGYTGGASGTLVVARAAATVTLQNLVHTYNGSPRTATVTTTPAGLAVQLTYDGSAAAPVEVGSYAVAAVVTDANHVGSASDTLTIGQAAVTITHGNLKQAYDGTPKSVTVGTDPAGLAVSTTYNGVDTPPTLPGSYEVVSIIDDENYSASATDTLVITVTALVRHAPVMNADIEGSVQMLLGENTTLNGSAMISGDLLVPGTPTVRLNGNPLFGGTLDGTGAAAPANYTITLNGGSLLNRVVRRTNPIAMPVVSAPPAPAGTVNVSLNQASQNVANWTTLRNLTLDGNVGLKAVPPGTYGNLTANANSGFILGVAGATEPAVYNLQSLTINGNAQVQLAGPVILTLASGTALNGPVGSAVQPKWMTLRIAAGGLTLNGNIAFHGDVLAPNGTVIINGNSTLNGTVAADRLTLNGTAFLAEPEPQE